jgi:heptosyltransferase-2
MSARLVILAPNWLGDAVMALPAVADVRRAHADAHITIAARPSVAPLYALVEGVDSMLTLSSGASLAGFDAALLLPNAFHAALAVWRARVPERWGYRADGRRLLLTRSVDRPPRPVHQVEYYRHLVAALGFANGSPEPRVRVTDAVRAAGADLLHSAGWDGRTPLVALAPGAAYGGAKRWPSQYFAELAADLARDGMQTVTIGSAADAASSAGVRATFDLIARTDLPTLAGVLVHARTLVTNDSGAMHLAAAAGVPVTAVFGPTRDRETRPLGNGHAVLTNEVWCRPCMLRECPLDHRCMRGVAPASVAASVRITMSGHVDRT